jgi:hypothetical protein
MKQELPTDQLQPEEKREKRLVWPAEKSAGPVAGLTASLAVSARSDLSGTDSLQQRVRDKVARVMARCAAVDVFVAAQLDFSSTTDDVESIYSDLQLFARAIHAVGEKAAGNAGGPGASDLSHLIEITGRLLESEKYLSHQVNQWLLHLQSRRGAEPSFGLFLTQVAAWHGWIQRELDRGRQKLELVLEQELHPEENEAALLARRPQAVWKLADDLVRAGELDLLPAFTALAATERIRLAEFLRSDRAYPKRAELLEMLWQVADLVALEDQLQPGQPSLLVLLCQDLQVGQRFLELARLLEEDEPAISSRDLERRFSLKGKAAGRELEVLWRALILAHPQPATRRLAATTAPLDALWSVIAHPASPTAAVHAVSAEVAARGDEDLRKVLFDCIKSRLFLSLGRLSKPEEARLLGEIVQLFFQFDFFIQTRYFEQLISLLQLYRAQARRFGLDLALLDRHWHRLEIARHKAGNPEATLPQGLDRLPLPIQRHLAREGCYLTYFACHANHLIAREVVHFIHADNLERFLRLIEVNRQLLEEALRRVDLSSRRELTIEVLSHPKCPQIFAGRHLPRLASHELHRIIQAASTHSEVKRKAMLLMIQQRGGAAKSPRGNEAGKFDRSHS